MQNIADAVLDYLLFLEFSDEEVVDPDIAVKRLDSLHFDIEEFWTPDEKRALSEAAARRLDSCLEEGERPDSTSITFLQAVKEGRLNDYFDAA